MPFDQGIDERILRPEVVVHRSWPQAGLTAALIDTVGASNARTEIAAIKIVAPRVAENVIGRAIEIHGAQGLSDDTPLAYFHAWSRALRVADGPDAVHLRTIAREEVRRERPHVG